MSNGGGMFSPEEVAYLKTLPAVAEATARRITYPRRSSNRACGGIMPANHRSNCSVRRGSTRR